MPVSSVYVVSAGKYSDHRILAIYSTREQAEAVTAFLKSTAERYDHICDVEEYELDLAIPPPGWERRWVAVFSPDGQELRKCESESGLDAFNPWECPRVHAFDTEIDVYVRADDEPTAIKLATEQIQKWRAAKAVCP